MRYAKIVGFALALLGTSLSGYTLFLFGAVCVELLSHGTPSGWNGWPDVLFFLLILSAFAVLGAVIVRWGLGMARAGTPEAEQSALNLIALALLFACIVGIIWVMRNSLDRLRWACAGVLCLLWLAIAASNAGIAWREFVKDEKKGPSPIMLVGGIMGLLAVNVIPQQWDSIKWPLRLAAVILDFGSAPMLLIGVGMICLGLTRDSTRKP